MQKISPYNPVVIETARRFNEAHNGDLLIEMIHDVEENGDESPYHFIFNADDSLLEGAQQADVGYGKEQVCYLGFLRCVSIAQAHLLREGEEISSLVLEIRKNFEPYEQLNVKNEIMKIGESLGESEANFYNYLIDLFSQIYNVKVEAIKAKLPPDDAVRDYLSGYDLEETLKHANFGLKEKSLSEVLGIILWASESPANMVEVIEPGPVVKND